MLKPLKPKVKRREFWGFDVETIGIDNEFIQGSITSGKKAYIFFDKALMAEFMLGMKGATFTATNLSFDFFSVYSGDAREKGFELCFRRDSSDLMFATNKRLKVDFIDTLNYARMSVSALGEILNLPKLPHPPSIPQDDSSPARMPTTAGEWASLVIYNIRDSEISRAFMQMKEEEIISLGGEMKLTIGSSYVNLFRCRYLEGVYYQGKEEDMEEIRKAYYGGRTEAFVRGDLSPILKERKLYLYDINSMFPWAMASQEYPNPNTKRVSLSGDIFLVAGFPGVSLVSIDCPPDMHIPLLPLRLKNKLIFPTGRLVGWYAHNELCEAMKLGYTIRKIYKTHYYRDSCRPFKKIVEDLYEKRMEYQRKGDKREKIIKLMINAGYGKWGQRFGDMEHVRHKDSLTKDDIDRYSFDEIGYDYVKFKEKRRPQPHCFPIWASYITAYARIYLHRYLRSCNPYYCDTDSIITDSMLPTGKALGMMKLEKEITSGIIVKPKFYILNGKVKAKGVGRRMTSDDFLESMQGKKVRYVKFAKFREAKRLKVAINKRLEVFKSLGLEDDKRVWPKGFDGTFQESRPINTLEVSGWKESIMKIA